MNARRRTAIAASAVALVAGGLLLLEHPRFSPLVQTASAVASSMAFLAGAAMAAARYRRGRDPHALFVAVALSVIGVQGAFAWWWGERLLHFLSAGSENELFLLPTSLGSPVFVPASNDVPVTAWLFGWAVGGILAALAVPWRDRRGRPPVRPVVVIGVTAAIVALVDVVIVALLDRQHLDPASIQPASGAGAAATAFGIVAIAALALAGARELRSASGTSAQAILAVGWIAAVVVPISQIPHATYGVHVSRSVDLWPLVIAALALTSVVAADTTEASRMRRATDHAQEILGGRAEIASMLAHEVKGPIATIKGLAATTAGSYDKLSDDERREFVGLIQDEAGRLLDVVDQASLALKIDARTLTFDRRRHDLAQIVQDAVAATQLTARDLDQALGEGIEVNADRRWLAHAIGQGLDNAIRFSPEGSPIGIAARHDGQRAVVEITDRGPGVPPERRDEVFTRFVRWRPPGYEDRQGSGLGLFICRGILAEHAGDASLEPRPGGGTMLRLTIPTDGPPPMEG